jgi:hypothetical protein
LFSGFQVRYAWSKISIMRNQQRLTGRQL